MESQPLNMGEEGFLSSERCDLPHLPVLALPIQLSLERASCKEGLTQGFLLSPNFDRILEEVEATVFLLPVGRSVLCEWRSQFLDSPRKIYVRIRTPVRTARRKGARTKELIKGDTL